MSVSPVPEGYHTATPYLFVRDAGSAIEFYRQTFGAEEVLRMEAPDGKMMHAEIKIGDSHIMLADEMLEMGVKSPQTLGGVSGSLMLYVADVDAQYQKALDQGCTELRPLQDQFWGDRMGTVVDPYGQQWSLATHIEDVPPEEMGQRFEAFMQQMAGGS